MAMASDIVGNRRPMGASFNDEGKYDWKETIEPHLKIAVIGESGCGKSALILAAKNQIFPHPDERLVVRRFCLDVEVDGKTEGCMVTEADIGDDKKSKIYSETDVVLLCFNEMQDLYSKVKKWIQELQNRMPTVPIIVVRIVKEPKSSDKFPTMINRNNINEYKRNDCTPYIQCCPHARKGVKEVFQAAVIKAKKLETEDNILDESIEVGKTSTAESE